MGPTWPCSCRNRNIVHNTGINYRTNLGKTNLGYVVDMGATTHNHTYFVFNICGIFHVTLIWGAPWTDFKVRCSPWYYCLHWCANYLLFCAILGRTISIPSAGWNNAAKSRHCCSFPDFADHFHHAIFIYAALENACIKNH